MRLIGYTCLDYVQLNVANRLAGLAEPTPILDGTSPSPLRAWACLLKLSTGNEALNSFNIVLFGRVTQEDRRLLRSNNVSVLPTIGDENICYLCASALTWLQLVERERERKRFVPLLSQIIATLRLVMFEYLTEYVVETKEIRCVPSKRQS